MYRPQPLRFFNEVTQLTSLTSRQGGLKGPRRDRTAPPPPPPPRGETRGAAGQAIKGFPGNMPEPEAGGLFISSESELLCVTEKPDLRGLQPEDTFNPGIHASGSPISPGCRAHTQVPRHTTPPQGKIKQKGSGWEPEQRNTLAGPIREPSLLTWPDAVSWDHSNNAKYRAASNINLGLAVLGKLKNGW